MKFVIVGAGAWGTAFAVHLARTGHAVALVPRRSEHADALVAARENVDYLPGIKMAPTIEVSADLERAVRGADVVLLACPAQALRETCARVGGGRFVVSLAKGLEVGTHRRPSEVIA